MDINPSDRPNRPLSPSRSWLVLILATPVLILAATSASAVNLPRTGWLLPILSTEFVLLTGLTLASRFRASLSSR